MRVIETFVKYVPREKIPADAKWFMQDKNGDLKCSKVNEKPRYSSYLWIRGIVILAITLTYWHHYHPTQPKQSLPVKN